MDYWHLESEELDGIVKWTNSWSKDKEFNPKTKEGLIGLLVEGLEQTCMSLYSHSSVLEQKMLNEHSQRNLRKIALAA